MYDENLRRALTEATAGGLFENIERMRSHLAESLSNVASKDLEGALSLRQRFEAVSHSFATLSDSFPAADLCRSMAKSFPTLDVPQHNFPALAIESVAPVLPVWSEPLVPPQEYRQAVEESTRKDVEIESLRAQVKALKRDNFFLRANRQAKDLDDDDAYGGDDRFGDGPSPRPIRTT